MSTKSHSLSALLLLLLAGLQATRTWTCDDAPPLDNELAESFQFPIIKNDGDQKGSVALAAEVSATNVESEMAKQTSESARIVVGNDDDLSDHEEAKALAPEPADKIDLDYSPPHEHPPHHN